MDVIYVDLAKAFDTVSHAKFVLKLKKLGFGGKTLFWLKYLLCGRKQAVIINKERSCHEPVLSGIPQGRIQGPPLFIIFIDYISHHIQHCSIKLLTDDTKIYRRAETMEDIELIKVDLHSLQNYFTT